MKKVLILSITLTLLVMTGAAAWAAGPWQVKSGTEIITQDQIIEGDLIFSGESLEIEGVVRGDLLVMAKQVTINGTVEGSIIGVVWQELAVNGTVRGNLRVLAGEVSLAGRVDRNLTLAAQSFYTDSDSRVGGGILGVFLNASLTGTVQDRVELRSYNATALNGSIAADLVLYGVAPSWNAITVSGRVLDHTPEGRKPLPKTGAKLGSYLSQPEAAQASLIRFLFWVYFVWFLGSLLMSLIFYSLFPRTAREITDPAPLNFWRSLFVGSLGFLVIPLAILLLIKSMVGIPIAVLLALFYLVLLLFSWVPLNIWCGRWLFKDRLRAPVLIALGGVIILVLSLMPVINLMLQLIGLGMLVRLVKPQIKEAPPIPQPGTGGSG